MSDLFWLSTAQMRRIEPYFPLSHGVARVDDRKVISGIIFVIRNGLRWRDAPKDYGPHKTIYNRFIRWSRLGVFNRIFAALAANRKVQIEYDKTLYRQRHKIENMFGRLKDWRRVHTRYDRCAHTFMSAICIAAAVIFWL
jgi:transposase